MFSSIRKIVAGPKKRTVTSNFDLDFTYIAETVVAMAYPASGLQQTYRNSIYDVAKYLQVEHNSNYLIINVSNRKYDYKVFHNKVKDYVWQDHQAPALDVLFDVCSDSYQFLKSQNGNGVVCFHCNHGKGRTGTAIICLFFYAGFFSTQSSAQQALRFYNKKRFEGQNYGVDQPCQVRYIQYFRQALIQHTSSQCRKTIKCFKLRKIEYDGLNQNQYQASVYMTRDMKVKYNKVPLKNFITIINDGEPIMSDIYIEVYQKGWTGSKIIARANINLNYCIKQSKSTQAKWSMIGSKVRLSSKHSPKFTIHFYFKQFCKCHEHRQQSCQCFGMREIQQQKWKKITKLAQGSCSLNSRETCQILFPKQCIQVQKQQVQKIEKEYEHQAKLDQVYLAQRIKEQYQKIINMAYIGQEQQQQQQIDQDKQHRQKQTVSSAISQQSQQKQGVVANMSNGSENVEKVKGKVMSSISVQGQQNLQLTQSHKKLSKSERIQIKRQQQTRKESS